MSERLFLAVTLDDEVRHGLAAFLESELAGRTLPGRPVRPENWHLTLRFLGRCEDQRRDRVLGFLEASLAEAPFTLGFAGLGGFPREQRASVLWLGVRRGAEEVGVLAAVTEEAAVAAGFSPEDRPFHPHVTLARVQPPEDVTALVATVAEFPLRQEVRAVTLYRSHLGRGGARYEAVDEVPLG